MPINDFGLKKFHITLFFIHFIQAFAILLLANNFTVPIVTNIFYLETRSSGIFTNTSYFTNISLVIMVWLYLMVTAFFHLLLINAKIYKWYEQNLIKNISYIRWIEYGISSSIIIVVVSILVGFLDATGLFLLFFVNLVMIFFGFLMERNNHSLKSGEKLDWLPFIAGSICGVIPWMIILIYYIASIYNNSSYLYSINFIVPVMIFLWILFPLNMFLHYKKVGVFKDYINTEKTYILLGLITKTLLAWQILFTFLSN